MKEHEISKTSNDSYIYESKDPLLDSDKKISKTTHEIYDKIGLRFDKVLKKIFNKKNINYPPSSISLIIDKSNSFMELWAKNKSKKWVYIKTYIITAESGTTGPKLKEGDLQIPEGIYKIVELNPNSKYHLSLKLNYPNKYDLSKAEQDGRTDIGSNIFIHGDNFSKGCIAIGDYFIEELFILIYKVGCENVRNVIITPVDFRKYNYKEFEPNNYTNWIYELYSNINKELSCYNDYY